MIYIVASIAALAGFLFGFDEGIIAGAEKSLLHEFPMSPFVQGFMTAAVPLGALVGAVIAGRLADRFGRRRVLLAAAFAFLLGSLASALAASVFILTMARLVLGLAIGVAGMVAPLYLSESSDARRRGAFVATYQLAITIGIVAAYGANYLLLEVGWRWMFACGIIPALVMMIGSLALPESPRWLALRGLDDQARKVLMRLRNNDAATVESELQAIEALSGTAARIGRFADLTSRRIRPAVIAALGLYVLQQLSGINAVIYYAPIIFAHTGMTSHSVAVLATFGLGIVNIAMTVVAMWFIDRIGRRRMLFAGLIGTALSLGAIVVTTQWSGSGWSVLPVMALTLYIGAFAVSLGPIPHIMMSEVFPLAQRGVGMGTASIANWGFNFVVVLLFPVALSGLGIQATMGFFLVVCVIGLAFTFRYVPETRGVTLEEIEARLDKGHLLQPIGRLQRA